MNTTGPILELGCGDYSTPALLSIAKAQGRKYLGQCSNDGWARQFENVEFVKWDTWEPPKEKWGMVFIDSDEPTWIRVKRIPQFKDLTDVIVLHDADISMKRDGWNSAIECFPNVVLYTKHVPWTAVMRKC